jgi:DNA topoisomerase IA
MNVVVVESPAKAKTINKYLGKDYQVLASYGHVRDLPAKDGSVLPEEDFAMSWTVDSRADKRIKEIAQAVKGSQRLYLATDPDREGEAISWHIAEELARRRALTGVEVKRVVFNEVTKTAVLEAFKAPRELNRELIEAYLARRALDYLVGFGLSGGFLPVARALAQTARQPLRRPGPVGRPAFGLRARSGDRELPAARVLVRRRRFPDRRQRPFHRPFDPPRGPQAGPLRPGRQDHRPGRRPAPGGRHGLPNRED